MGDRDEHNLDEDEDEGNDDQVENEGDAELQTSDSSGNNNNFYHVKDVEMILQSILLNNLSQII